MKKRAIRKDFYMEIRKSRGRFLSIFFIVALGVAFFSGIRASEPDMRYSGDAYFDRKNLMDIRVMGNMGMTDRDVEALRGVEGVGNVEPGYSADVLVEANGSQKVLHVSSILDTMNRYTLDEGRMPEKSGECLMDQDFLAGYGLEIGDEVKLFSGTDDALSDTFETDTFTIVGSGSSASYISFDRGSSTIGNGEVSGFLAVLPEDFSMDVYTECYVSVEGAKELTAFTEEYDRKVDVVIGAIEDIEERQGKLRADDIRDEANEKLADAKKELADAEKEAAKELGDAEQKIEDGKQKLADGRKELADGRAELEDNRAALWQGQQEIDEAYSGLEEGWAQLEAGQAELAAKEAEFWPQYESGMAQLDAGQAALDAGWQEWKTKKSEYDAGAAQLAGAKIQLQQLLDAVAGGQLPEEQLAPTQGQIAALEGAIAGQEPVLNAAAAQLAEAERTLLAKGEELTRGREQLLAGQAAIEQARMELLAGQSELEAGAAQAEEGQRQIDEGWAALAEGEARLADGEAEIVENERKLADAEREYTDGRKEADEKIKDGKNKIKDAEADIAKIEDAKWYVDDRSVISEYTGYGDNADRMRAIGEVFPILFFVVAALISLTTMTRMVEEQRTQIGTLKALGYGKLAIAGKYLNYALLATIGGSIVGVAFGEKFFPYVIVTAYKIMYAHLPDVVLPYNWNYALLATAAAVACTGAATLAACYAELASQPAVLMRPPAPKQGKRVFLERLPFLWKRLSFIWKSTIRNLIRYKKRFFMTIFGIGGCMALMIVGFGIRDSIFDVGKIQYGELSLFDGMIILNSDADAEDRESLRKVLDAEKEISSVSEGYLKKIDIQSGENRKEVFLQVPESLEKNKEFFVYRDRNTHEEYALGEDDVILTEKTAKLLDIQRGDTVTLQNEKGEDKELTVTDICENYMEHYLYLSPDTYEEIYGEPMETNTVYFKMQHPDEKRTKEIGEKILDERAALSVSYTYNIEGELDDMLESLDIVIVVLIVSAGLLAFVVLYNLNNININERKRELATIKVLGFYDKEVSAYVYRENILLTIIGTLVGILLGSLLHRYVIVTVEIDKVMFARTVKAVSFAYSALLTCAFSLFVNAVMYFKLKKIDMVESLKSVE